MKRILLFYLLASVLMPAPKGNAQTEITTIDFLQIDIWPDYDKAPVLVLLTGTLPIDTRLPARVTLPLPENAQFNAIARIDGRDGRMKDDILTYVGQRSLTFITPDLGFRMEYYFPYTAKGTDRSFEYVWLSKISVNKLQIKVQKPTSAVSIRTVPMTVDVAWDDDGFSYHTFPVKPVAAGRRLSLKVNYTLTDEQLSVERLPASDTEAKAFEVPPLRSTTGSGINWPIMAIAAGGIIIVLTLVWFIFSRHYLSAPAYSGDTQDIKQNATKFCNVCGEPAADEHRYCSQCGNALEG